MSPVRDCEKLVTPENIGIVRAASAPPLAPRRFCARLGPLASCHVCASTPNFLVLEWHWLERPYWDTLLVTDKPVIQNGSIQMPDKPGIGAELNEEVARQYLRTDTEFFD